MQNIWESVITSDSFKRFNGQERIGFLLLLALITLAFIILLREFFQPLCWAVALAIIFRGFYSELDERLGGKPSLAASLTLLVILLAIIMPVMLLGLAVTREIAILLDDLQSQKIDVGAPLQWIGERVPVVLEYLERAGVEADKIRTALSDSALGAGRWIAGNALKIGQSTLSFNLMLALASYLLFFFLRDGERIVARIMAVAPLGGAAEQRLLGRFADTVRATVKGIFVIGAAQGAIGGVTFALLGIRGAVLWGVMMALMSLLPMIGAAIIWVPAALILVAQGAYVKGAILAVVGLLVISLVDNLLRPIVVGRGAALPDYVILLSSLGGLASFGLTGLIVGPVVAALCLTMWEMMGQAMPDTDADP